MEEVYVVTTPEDGWDCVQGVFTSLESLQEHFLEILGLEWESPEENYFLSLEESDFKEVIRTRFKGRYVIQQTFIH
ncbi:MAG: hypothetical protein ACOH2V_00925 [Candidatus Saccharimonadaceae bacterium]